MALRVLEDWLAHLIDPDGSAGPAFLQPPGEPALMAADSVSWRVFKNPLAVYVGGVAGVLLQLAEPRVGSGVWQYTSFRERPMDRVRRTAHAAMLTVYGPRSRAESMIAGVNRMHSRVRGTARNGRAFRADDPELLEGVVATSAVFLRGNAGSSAWQELRPTGLSCERIPPCRRAAGSACRTSSSTHVAVGGKVRHERTRSPERRRAGFGAAAGGDARRRRA